MTALPEKVRQLADLSSHWHDGDALRLSLVLELAAPFAVDPVGGHAGPGQQHDDEGNFVESLLDFLRELLADPKLPLVQPDLDVGELEVGRQLASENLYLAAYALTHGARLKRISVSRSNGRKTAVFELDSPWVQKLSDEFYTGTAVVNLAEYRNHLEELKDQLFAAPSERISAERVAGAGVP